MEQLIWDSGPYVRGAGINPEVKGRLLTAPPSPGINLAELISIVKKDAPHVYLSDVYIRGGHVWWQRLETADEAAERDKKWRERNEYVRQGRYQAYLKLKEEFESDGVPEQR